MTHIMQAMNLWKLVWKSYKNIDILICAGEASKFIIEEAKKNSKIRTYYFNNNEEIVEKLNQELKNGDVI